MKLGCLAELNSFGASKIIAQAAVTLQKELSLIDRHLFSPLGERWCLEWKQMHLSQTEMWHFKMCVSRWRIVYIYEYCSAMTTHLALEGSTPAPRVEMSGKERGAFARTKIWILAEQLKVKRCSLVVAVKMNKMKRFRWGRTRLSWKMWASHDISNVPCTTTNSFQLFQSQGFLCKNRGICDWLWYTFMLKKKKG